MPATRPAVAPEHETATRAPRRGRLVAAATVAALCLSFATIQAADAATSVDPATYVHSICTTLDGYKTQLTGLQNSTDLANSTSLAEIRDKLVAFLSQATTVTDTTATGLQSAGAPSIKNGDKIATLIVAEVTALRDAFAKATRSAQALNVGNIKKFKKQELAISKQINTAGSKVKGVFTDAKKKYDTKPLKASQTQDPSCQSLR